MTCPFIFPCLAVLFGDTSTGEEFYYLCSPGGGGYWGDRVTCPREVSEAHYSVVVVSHDVMMTMMMMVLYE